MDPNRAMAELLNEIYDALLMRHIRGGSNYGLRDDIADSVEISNALCGDVLQLQVAWEAGHLASLRFSCECCGIAMGNASLMTAMVPGLDRDGARRLADAALDVLRGGTVPDAAVAHLPAELAQEASAGWALLVEIGRRLPARRTCASLAWQALGAVLDGRQHAAARDLRA